MEIFRNISLTSLMLLILDVLITWIFIYLLMRILKNNERAGQIFKGFMIVILARYLASWIGLKIVSRFLTEIMNWGLVIAVIIFAPEIRSALENVGKKTIFSKNVKLLNNEKDVLVAELCEAVNSLAKTNTGALITIQMQDSLNEFIQKGVLLEAQVTKELLGNIFYPKTPLHDGAAIIVGNRLVAASVFFPSPSTELISQYGARHRAALAISEISDSITIIVSEETGEISIASKGQIHKITISELADFLNDQLSVFEQNQLPNKSIFQQVVNPTTSKSTIRNNQYTKTEILESQEKVTIYYRKKRR